MFFDPSPKPAVMLHYDIARMEAQVTLASMRSLAKYLEIQKTGWSAVRVYSGNVLDAHCKELSGLPVDTATNRREVERAKLCPADKGVAIKKAFEHFGMLQ